MEVAGTAERKEPAEKTEKMAAGKAGGEPGGCDTPKARARLEEVVAYMVKCFDIEVKSVWGHGGPRESWNEPLLRCATGGQAGRPNGGLCRVSGWC